MGSSCRSRCFPCCQSSNPDSVEDSISIDIRPRHSPLNCPNCGRDFSRVYSSRDFPNHVIRCTGRRTSKGRPSKDSPYETKSIWLREYLNKIRIPWTQESIKIIITRDEIIQSTMNNLDMITVEDMHKEFQITFVGEIAMDAGGLLREWFTLLMKKFFSEEFGLMDATKSSCVSYYFKPTSKQEIIKQFNLLGKVLAKALFEKTPVYCPLNRIIFKHLVQEKPVLDDLVYYDEELYKSLVFLRDNDITGLFFETFIAPQMESGDKTRVELRPGGSEEMVNEENKQDYLALLLEFIIQKSVAEPLAAFLDGFYYVIPKEIISVLNPDEAELIICGLPYIDLQEWQDFTEYRGELSKSHETIIEFWKILNDLSQDELSLLILFVTGTPRLPVEGFASLKTTRGDPARFTIEPVPYSPGILPRAHTCFNRLDLPIYPTADEMKESLLNVLKNHTFGFGIE